MKLFLLIFFNITLIFSGCCNTKSNSNIVAAEEPGSVAFHTIIIKKNTTIESRFQTPKAYSRITLDDFSYGSYLRSLQLKPFGSKVFYWNGQDIKRSEGIYISVIDMGISKRDLQQCADAVMRLKGEYLYHAKRYDEIHFNFLSDGKPRYYKEFADGDYSYATFLKYMDYIFAYANTRSLYNELIPVENIKDIQPGDVFIQIGNPYGHAVIVLDVAQNEQGKKIFILGQSYMPAQETQVLINPGNKMISPWYEANEGVLNTPEWRFSSEDLRRF